MKSLDYKFDFRDERNLSLVMDFYELTMSQCYFNSDHKDRVVTFDLFYRRNPDSGGYAVFAGLEEIIGYIQNLHFEDSDIAYLRSLNRFNDEFLEYLRHFIFTGDIFAVKEGTPVFPYEPLIRVKAGAIGERGGAPKIESILVSKSESCSSSVRVSAVGGRSASR